MSYLFLFFVSSCSDNSKKKWRKSHHWLSYTILSFSHIIIRYIFSGMENFRTSKKAAFIYVTSRIHNLVILWESPGLHNGSYSLWCHTSWLHPWGSMVAWWGFQECLMASLWEEICVFHVKMKGEETDMAHSMVSSVCQKAYEEMIHNIFFLLNLLTFFILLPLIWLISSLSLMGMWLLIHAGI